MTEEERETLIMKLVKADFQNVLNDFDLFIFIMRGGHKGYDHMDDEELNELYHGGD